MKGGAWHTVIRDESRMALICNEMARIDDDFAGIEFRLQNIGKH